MDPQLITAGGIDITTADFLYLSYSALDKLVVQLKTAHTAAIQAKHRAILYHKFDNPPKACSQDFNSLLLTRYGEDAESSQVFLSSLSLPAFLEVIYSLTKKHLEAGEKYLTDFAIYANKRSKLSESLVNRARRELQRGSEDRHLEFEREVRRCQGDPPLHMLFSIFTNTTTAAVPKHSASRKRRRTKTPLNNQSTQDGAQPSTVLNDVSMIPSVSGDLLYSKDKPCNGNTQVVADEKSRRGAVSRKADINRRTITTSTKSTFTTSTKSTFTTSTKSTFTTSTTTDWITAQTTTRWYPQDSRRQLCTYDKRKALYLSWF